MNAITMLPEQELLSLEEAAEFLCVSKSTMYRLLDQGKLRGMKAGKQWRFNKEDLLAYMQRGPAAQALAQVPISVLDAELAFLAGELAQAGTSTAMSDDPTLDGEAGKITQLVRRMTWLLVTLRGSDLHLNPVWDAGGVAVLLILRVDGALRELRRLPATLLEALVMEWKLQAGLQLEERQRPQEGCVQLAFGQQLSSLRVSIIPTLYGEKVTARTVPTRVPSLEELGIAETPIKEWSAKQHGLVIFSGPTGSGKSTTAAACVREILARRDCNIISVVAPVEYIFPHGVTHLKIEQYTRAEALRAVLRHDPDVILVGEQHEEPESARLAVEAAEIGYLVLTTYHSHDAIRPLYDLLELGVKRTLLADNLVGVCQQRLAPKPCPACMTATEPDPAVRESIRRAAAQGGCPLPEDAVFYQPAGCEACRGHRYGGRLALHEWFTFTPALRAAFLGGASYDDFTRLAREEGQYSFFAAQVPQAMRKVIALETLLRYLPY